MIIPILIGIALLSGCASYKGSRAASKVPVAPKGKSFEHHLSKQGDCFDEFEIRQAVADQLLNICNGRGSMKFHFPTIFSCDGGQYSIDEHVTITCKDDSDCEGSSIYSASNDDLHGLYPLTGSKGKAIEEIVVSNKFVDECDSGAYTFAARFKDI